MSEDNHHLPVTASHFNRTSHREAGPPQPRFDSLNSQPRPTENGSSRHNMANSQSSPPWNPPKGPRASLEPFRNPNQPTNARASNVSPFLDKLRPVQDPSSSSHVPQSIATSRIPTGQPPSPPSASMRTVDIRPTISHSGTSNYSNGTRMTGNSRNTTPRPQAASQVRLHNERDRTRDARQPRNIIPPPLSIKGAATLSRTPQNLDKTFDFSSMYVEERDRHPEDEHPSDREYEMSSSEFFASFYFDTEGDRSDAPLPQTSHTKRLGYWMTHQLRMSALGIPKSSSEVQIRPRNRVTSRLEQLASNRPAIVSPTEPFVTIDAALLSSSRNLRASSLRVTTDTPCDEGLHRPAKRVRFHEASEESATSSRSVIGTSGWDAKFGAGDNRESKNMYEERPQSGPDPTNRQVALYFSPRTPKNRDSAPSPALGRLRVRSLNFSLAYHMSLPPSSRSRASRTPRPLAWSFCPPEWFDLSSEYGIILL